MNKVRWLIFVVFVFVAMAGYMLVGLKFQDDADSSGQRRLVFEDNMNGRNGKWELRADIYPNLNPNSRAANSAVTWRDGQLVLDIKPDLATANFLTGVLVSNKKFTYGWYETRIKFGSKIGAHGAFWLAPTEDYREGQAEIDVVESSGGSDNVFHHVYWREPGQLAGEFTHVQKSTHLDPTTWHTYTLRWLPNRYDFYVDGRLRHTITEGLSNRPKVMVLSVLIEDYEYPDTLRPLIDYRVTIDYVKVWQQN